MHIQSTKKVLDFLKTVVKEINTKDVIYAWHMNYKTMSSRDE